MKINLLRIISSQKISFSISQNKIQIKRFENYVKTVPSQNLVETRLNVSTAHHRNKFD